MKPLPITPDSRSWLVAALVFIFHQKVKTTGFQPVSFSYEKFGM